MAGIVSAPVGPPTDGSLTSSGGSPSPGEELAGRRMPTKVVRRKQWTGIRRPPWAYIHGLPGERCHGPTTTVGRWLPEPQDTTGSRVQGEPITAPRRHLDADLERNPSQVLAPTATADDE